MHAAALLFMAVLVGFLVVYPTFYGFDEPQHVDRIYATTDGELLPDPGELEAAVGIARGQNAYVPTWPYRPDHSYADYPALPRDDRPSLIDLGAHTKTSPGGYSNQLSEHPPAYYWLLGAVMWLLPGDASLPVDVFVFVLRALNVLLVAPVPYLIWWGTRHLTGEGPAAQAAAFVPALVPGLGRVGATVNNDNLLVLLTTALLALLAAVTKGDVSAGTARRVAALLALALVTKGNALILPVVVGAAYLVGWRVSRARVPWPAFCTVIAGGALGGLWWLRNLLEFGTVRPAGWGNRLATALGPPRQPGDPADWDFFWTYVEDNLPSRFWGGLGLIEPPTMPGWSVAALGILTAGALVVCVLFAHGNRAPVLVLASGLGITLVLTVQAGWSHYQSYTTIPGVQGRYGYPFILGLAVVLALGITLVLGPLRRAAPAVLLVMALVAEYVAVTAVVRHIWLPDGEQLGAANARFALGTIARFAPFSKGVTAALLAFVALAVVAAVALTIRGVVAPRREPAERAVRPTDTPSMSRSLG